MASISSGQRHGKEKQEESLGRTGCLFKRKKEKDSPQFFQALIINFGLGKVRQAAVILSQRPGRLSIDFFL